MDNIETFHHQKKVAAENVGSRFEADLFKSVQMILDCFVVMDSIQTFRHKKMVAADTVGFRFEADLFKSVPMIFGFGTH